MLPALVGLVGLVALAGDQPTLRWLRIIPIFMMMALFCAGVAFFAARLTIHVRDIAQLIPFINRLIFYVSGIFFVVGQRYATRPELLYAIKFNPLNVYITLVRDSMLTRSRMDDGIRADMLTWQLGLAWGVVMFVVGFIFFWRAEGLYGRE